MSIQPVKRGKVVPPQNAVPFPITGWPLPPIPTVEGGTALPMPVPSPQPGPWWKNPALPGMLVTIGSQLGAPPQFGQNAWGKLAQSLGAGFNYLQQYRQLPQLAQREQWERQMQVEQLRNEQYKAQTERKRQAAEEATGSRRVGVEEKRVGIEEKRATTEAERVKGELANAQELLKLRQRELTQRATDAYRAYKLERDKLTEQSRHNRAAEGLERQKNATDAAYKHAQIARLLAEAKADEAGPMAKLLSNPDAFARIVQRTMESIRDTELLQNGKVPSDDETFGRAIDIVMQTYGRYAAAAESIRGGQASPQQQQPQASQQQQQQVEGKPRVFEARIENGRPMVLEETKREIENAKEGDIIVATGPGGKKLTWKRVKGAWVLQK